MLLIEIGGTAATWDEEATRWHSADKRLEQVLDDLIPEPALDVHAMLLEGGKQKLALESAQAFFGSSLTVVANVEPPPVGDPPPGVEY
jgi:hypothetical protein